jgi:hypothetical protein
MQTISLKARTIAVFLTASSSIGAAFPISAQQVASGPDISKCETAPDIKQRPDCDLDASIANSKARMKAADEKSAAAKASITNSKRTASDAAQQLATASKSITTATKSIETGTQTIAVSDQSIAASEVKAAEFRKEEACGKQLIELAKDPEKQTKGRLALTSAGMDVAQFGACKLVRHLTIE